MSELRGWIRERSEEVAGLLARMISIPSVTGDELALARACCDWLGEHGVAPTLVPCLGRANAVGVVGAGERALVLSGHLDTVPPEPGAWSGDAFEPRREGDRIHGLGASDMKASLAAAAFAARWLAESGAPLAGRLVLAFTVEEETTGRGTVELLRWARATGFLDPPRTSCIVMEPTGLEPCLGNRGTVFARIELTGLGGHGSRPAASRNPIDECRALLARLADLQDELGRSAADPDLGAPTLTPTVVRAGDGARPNAIPERAELVVDCRVPPALWADGFAPLRERLEEVVVRRAAAGYTARLELVNARPGQRLARDHALPATVLELLRGPLRRPTADFHFTPAGNDAVFFEREGIPALNKLGPGLTACAHRADEYALLPLVLDAVELYARAATAILGE